MGVFFSLVPNENFLRNFVRTLMRSIPSEFMLKFLWIAKAENLKAIALGFEPVRSANSVCFHASVRTWSPFRMYAQILPFSQKIACASSSTGRAWLFSLLVHQKKIVELYARFFCLKYLYLKIYTSVK